MILSKSVDIFDELGVTYAALLDNVGNMASEPVEITRMETFTLKADRACSRVGLFDAEKKLVTWISVDNLLNCPYLMTGETLTTKLNGVIILV